MIEFTATGHKNILATHKTTIEFTKSKDLSVDGDCIIAVNTNFDKEKLKELVKSCEKIKVTITVDDISESVESSVNKQFECDEEIVLRLGDFSSPRTLGTRSSKAAVHVNRKLIERLQNPAQKVMIRIDKL